MQQTEKIIISAKRLDNGRYMVAHNGALLGDSTAFDTAEEAMAYAADRWPNGSNRGRWVGQGIGVPSIWVEFIYEHATELESGAPVQPVKAIELDETEQGIVRSALLAYALAKSKDANAFEAIGLQFNDANSMNLSYGAEADCNSAYELLLKLRKAV